MKTPIIVNRDGQDITEKRKDEAKRLKDRIERIWVALEREYMWRSNDKNTN